MSTVNSRQHPQFRRNSLVFYFFYILRAVNAFAIGRADNKGETSDLVPKCVGKPRLSLRKREAILKAAILKNIEDRKGDTEALTDADNEMNFGLFDVEKFKYNRAAADARAWPT